MAGNEKWVRCNCGSEMLCVSWGEDGEWGIDIAFWQMGQGEHKSWRERLRHIWRIIRRGTPYSDYIILEPDEARALAHVLMTAAGDEDRKGTTDGLS